MSTSFSIDIYDVDKLIKANNLQQVTNPIMFNRDKIPTEDGILSYKIFGRTTGLRAETFAYIDLYTHVFDPDVYISLTKISRLIIDIVHGRETVSITKNGELIKDPDGGTGMDFLYNNWDKIKFRENGSKQRDEKVKMINSLKKSEIFVSKWIVCPPFFRDVNMDKTSSGKISTHEINDYYNKLISMGNVIKNNSGIFNLTGISTKANIQDTLLEIRNFFIGTALKGKQSLVKKGGMGTNVDNGSRLVISNHRYKEDSYKDMTVNFEYSGVPLDCLCVLFAPFLIKWLKDFFYENFYINKKVMAYNKKTKKHEYIKIKDVHKLIGNDFIDKNVNSFIHSYADRYRLIEFEAENGTVIHIPMKGYITDKKDGKVIESFNRNMTWTDLLYMAICDICEDKAVIITRYPIDDIFNIIGTKIFVNSTIKTVRANVNGKYYPHYPSIDLSLTPEKVSTQFISTLNLSNAYLKGMGADYDGDQITIKGVYTKEAVKEVIDKLYDIKNLLNTSGELVRSIEKEAVQCLYSLTRKHPAVFE